MTSLCRLRRFLGLTQTDVETATSIPVRRLSLAEQGSISLTESEEQAVSEYLADRLRIVSAVSKGQHMEAHLPRAIETALAVLRVRLVDFVFLNLAQHVARLRELRKASPSDVFFASLDRTDGDELIPVLSEPMQTTTNQVSPVCPFNLVLPRDICLAFVNLVAHALWLEWQQVSVGFVNVCGHGFVFRFSGIDCDGQMDVQSNELLGALDETRN